MSKQISMAATQAVVRFFNHHQTDPLSWTLLSQIAAMRENSLPSDEYARAAYDLCSKQRKEEKTFREWLKGSYKQEVEAICLHKGISHEDFIQKAIYEYLGKHKSDVLDLWSRGVPQGENAE